MKSWRLIPLWRGSGQLQMAIDQWLFDQCCQGLHPPVLRFYTWSPAAISLGYHQHQWPQHWHTLEWQNQPLDLVRRPTGGRAVLHAGDLTYGMVLPNQSRHRRQTYEYICGFLIQGWRSLGVNLQFGRTGHGYQRQVNCFESATAADLIDFRGEKLIGSAQAWRGQTVLQHGSMQLQPDLGLQQQVFGDEAVLGGKAAGARSPDQVIEALVCSAEDYFGAVFQVQPLTEQEWSLIQAQVSAPVR